MSKKFPYLFVPGTHGPTPRSVIPVQIGLNASDGLYAYPALIDSGADICMFPPEVAREIGIVDLTSGRRNGASGVVEGISAEYYIHRISINVGGWIDEIDAGFMPGLTRLGHGILGQKGFFENFIVKFDLRKGEIELERHDS